MQLFGNWWRQKRGDVSWLVFAAVFAVLVLPAVGQVALAAPMQAQSCEAIFMWLHSDAASAANPKLSAHKSLLSLTNRLQDQQTDERSPFVATVLAQMPESASLPLNAAAIKYELPPTPRLLEFHEASHRNGIRTNRRLN